MQPSVKHIGVVTGFVLLGLLLIGNALVTKHRLNVQAQDAQLALHSGQVRVAIEEMESTLRMRRQASGATY